MAQGHPGLGGGIAGTISQQDQKSDLHKRKAGILKANFCSFDGFAVLMVGSDSITKYHTVHFLVRAHFLVHRRLFSQSSHGKERKRFLSPFLFL